MPNPDPTVIPFVTDGSQRSLCVTLAAGVPQLARRRVQSTKASVGVAEQFGDASTQCSDRNDSDDGDKTHEQRVLHHGGAALRACPLEQRPMCHSDRDERVHEHSQHVDPLLLLHAPGWMTCFP